MIRLVLAGLSALVGVLSLMLVISAFSVVGFDDVTETKAHQVSPGTYAVVMDEQIVPFANTTATIRASSDKEILLGTANGVDSSSYLTGVQHEEISDVNFPGSLDARVIAGNPAPGQPAESRDWWVDTKVGTQVSTTFDVDGTPQTVVIAPTGEGGNLDGTTVVVSMKVHGVLSFCLLGVALTLVTFAVAFALFMWWRNDQPRPGKKFPRGGAGAGKGKSTRAATPTRTRAATAKRTAATATLASVLVVSGCGLPVAKPETPDIQPYTRPGIRQGEAAKFMQRYSDQLDRAFNGEPQAVESVQAGPLLDRTRSEMAIAERLDTKVTSPKFDTVLAGSPEFTTYPMWFMAFGHVNREDSQTLAMVVTRNSATDEWVAVQGLMIPGDQVPTMEANPAGSVPPAPEDFGAKLAATSDAVAQYLSTGDLATLTNTGAQPAGKAFEDYRNYVDSYTEGDNAFDSADSQCTASTEANLGSYALATTDGAVGFGEIRCTLTLEAAVGSAITLPQQLDAVRTSGKDGNRVIVDTSIPIYVHQTGGGVSVVGQDWFLLDSRVEKAG